MTAARAFTVAEVAGLQGISERLVYHARFVLWNGHPAIADAVRAGKLSVGSAELIVRNLNTDDQARLAANDDARRRWLKSCRSSRARVVLDRDDIEGAARKIADHFGDLTEVLIFNLCALVERSST